jgi:hypothetical protein
MMIKNTDGLHSLRAEYDGKAVFIDVDSAKAALPILLFNGTISTDRLAVLLLAEVQKLRIEVDSLRRANEY